MFCPFHVCRIVWADTEFGQWRNLHFRAGAYTVGMTENRFVFFIYVRPEMVIAVMILRHRCQIAGCGYCVIFRFRLGRLVGRLCGHAYRIRFIGNVCGFFVGNVFCGYRQWQRVCCDRGDLCMVSVQSGNFVIQHHITNSCRSNGHYYSGQYAEYEMLA